MNEQELDHAEQNARAWLESIIEMVAPLVDEDDEDGDSDDEAKQKAREAITESVLSVGVRDTTFRTPGDTTVEPDEFEILLSTGGPALRIVGNLGRFNAPEAIELQKQDWFKPWTAMTLSHEEREAVQLFVEQFYLGDG